MKELKKYVQRIKDKGQPELATSITKTATEIGQKYISNFDYRSSITGLLLGNIQSGKTGQVFGIACEAVDRGFPFFLLLTTDNILLQEQTLARAENDLPDFVVCGENQEQKFLQRGSNPAIVVLKKNVNILNQWTSILKHSQVLLGNPLFIIDDEADAASLNTTINLNKVSSINKYLNEIRKNAQSSIFLQVTGTPQALLLQSSNATERPNFIYYFEPGESYLGGDFFFPSSNKIPPFVHFVDDIQASEVAKEVTLRHLVVTAQVMLNGARVSNCIVHPGIRTNAHTRAKEELEQALTWWTFHHNDDNFQKYILKIYDSLTPTKFEKASFKEVYTKVLSMLETRDYNMVTLNGISADSGESYEIGCNFIIGGTSLGRGVTFKQLNTFYYTRSSKNPQADTMWQHSRMFGYDRDPGLISVYCSRELYQLFTSINETNNSIIEQAKKGDSIQIGYPDNLSPTRKNVLNRSLLDIKAGGSNHFPVNPENKTFDDLSSILERFTDKDGPLSINLNFMLKILSHFDAEESFNLKGYMDIIRSVISINPLAQGKILVRRNRDITRETRALLSPNDWSQTNSYENEFVLTLYCVLGQKEKGWDGHPLWVPNIKLPKTKDFYLIN
ncbi:Z1 domain-containing protein [Enterococcus asini]|uniref:Z1 domain-containing protein n=1 Tax=Enterococcus asini TaxID=57732 RepID=UPI0028919A78|nr:Z1 domain-containing protein [Enterococcus asini]MDT2757987.1 Z1 domain-containing protein [Enterococcus asini]